MKARIPLYMHGCNKHTINNAARIVYASYACACFNSINNIASNTFLKPKKCFCSPLIGACCAEAMAWLSARRQSIPVRQRFLTRAYCAVHLAMIIILPFEPASAAHRQTNTMKHKLFSVAPLYSFNHTVAYGIAPNTEYKRTRKKCTLECWK